MDRKDEFNRAVVELQQDKVGFGTVRMGRRSVGDGDGDGDGIGNDGEMGIEGGGGGYGGGGKNVTNGAPATATATAKSDNGSDSTSTLLHSPKTLIDPSDPSLTITYERFGARLDCSILFGAALDALATLAQDDDGDTIDMFTGENWSQKVVYQTFSATSPYGGLLLTVDVVKRVMRLLPQRLWEGGECGEVGFRMLVGGVRMGAGRFWVPDFVEGGRGRGGRKGE